MNEIQGTAGGRGHVRAVFSERCRGFSVPLDLVRVHLRAVCRLAMLGRVRDAFAGYLVTDSDDVALRELEQMEAGYPFSNAREKYRPTFDRLATTGSSLGHFICKMGLHLKLSAALTRRGISRPGPCAPIVANNQATVSRRR